MVTGKKEGCGCKDFEAIEQADMGYGLYYDPSDNTFFIEDCNGETTIKKSTVDILLREEWIKCKRRGVVSPKSEFWYYVYELTSAGRAALEEIDVK